MWLELLHRIPLARPVRRVRSLRDHAIETAAAGGTEPLQRRRALRRGRREGEPSAGGKRAGERFELNPPLVQRTIQQRFATRIAQQVEDDEQGGGSRGQPAHPRLRRMNTLQQGVEREPLARGDHDFAIDDEPRRPHRCGSRRDLGKIPRERLSGLRLELHTRTVAEGQAAKAVPLGLELPVGTPRQFLHGLRFHWSEAKARNGAAHEVVRADLRRGGFNPGRSTLAWRGAVRDPTRSGPRAARRWRRSGCRGTGSPTFSPRSSTGRCSRGAGNARNRW